MRLSIIVPVYNVEPYLAACLDSLLAQQDTEDAYEIVCVNDGSTDNSGEILARYAQAHPSVRVITQKNGGLSAARNAGISAAVGEYLWFVDSDDVVDTYAVGQLCNAAAAHRWPDKVLFCYEEFMDGHLEEHRKAQKQSGQVVLFASGMQMDASKQVPPWNIACNYMIKRALLQVHGLLFVEGMLFEDEEFNFWLSRYTGRCIYLNCVFYYYRKRAGSILNTFMEGRFEQYINGRIHLAALHRGLLRGYNDPAQEKLRAVVSQQDLAAAVLYDIQGVLARLLVKGNADYFESYLRRLKQEEFYPYPVPWKNLVPRKSIGKTLINWAALGFPAEWLLRGYFAVAKRLKKGGKQ